jgi:hypothetical protein
MEINPITAHTATLVTKFATIITTRAWKPRQKQRNQAVQNVFSRDVFILQLNDSSGLLAVASTGFAS